MKKPKSTISKQVRQKPSKLEKAKERFVDDYAPLRQSRCLNRSPQYDPVFKRQLNNLIRLAKEEGRKGK